MKTETKNVRIKKSLHKKLKALKVKTGVSIEKTLETVLTQYFKNQKEG